MSINQYQKDSKSRAVEITSIETDPSQTINIKVLGITLYPYDDTKDEYGVNRKIRIGKEMENILNLYRTYRDQSLEYKFPGRTIYSYIEKDQTYNPYPNLVVMYVLTKEPESIYTILDYFRCYSTDRFELSEIEIYFTL